MTRGSFPALMLAPVNFDALYAQELGRMQAAGNAWSLDRHQKSALVGAFFMGDCFRSGRACWRQASYGDGHGVRQVEAAAAGLHGQACALFGGQAVYDFRRQATASGPNRKISPGLNSTSA